MDLLSRIREILAAESNDQQLDRFLTEVRDSLAASSRKFVGYGALIAASLVTYQLIVHEGSTSISFSGVQLTNTMLFRRVFLAFPAGLLAAMASVGYLRRLQRETFDYLTISRYRALGQTGLHELRLPADYILALFVLRNEGGLAGKVVSYVVTFLSIAIFHLVPGAYIIAEAITNLNLFGFRDILCVTASVAAIVLCICSFVIIRIARSIKAG